MVMPQRAEVPLEIEVAHSLKQSANLPSERSRSDTSAADADSVLDRRPGIEFLSCLWERRVFLSRVTVVAAVVSCAVAFLIPRRFDSTTRLMPPDDHTNSPLAMLASLGGQAGALGSLASDVLGTKTSGALFIGVLTSQTVEDRMIDRFNLRKEYRKQLYQDARKELEGRTSISEDRKSGIITITVGDSDPNRSSEMARAYVDELDRLVSQLSTSSAHRERVFLEERLMDVKKDLDEASSNLGEFSSKNGTIDVQTQGKAMVDAAAQLQGQLIANQAMLESLRQTYSDNNIRVREMSARVAELQKQLAKIGGASGGSAGERSQDDTGYPTIRQLPLLGVKYYDLYRRAKIEEAVFETLTQQYELAKVQEAKETPSVKVLDVAQVPEKQSFPPRTSLTLLGSVFGLFCGILFIAGETAWSRLDSEDPVKRFARVVLRDARDSVRVTTLGDQLGGLADETQSQSDRPNDFRA